MKEKGIKILFSIFLFASILMPFSVSADMISQSDIQGVERVLVNSTYLDQTVTNSGNTYKYYSFDYEVTVLLKDYYLGWIQGVFQTSFKTFDNANWQVQNSSCTTVSKSYYVNDNKFKSSFTITAWVLVNQQGNVDPAGSYTTSFTLSNSNVVAYQDLNSIDTVIDILQDVSQYVSIDILNELQDIVTNTSLSNTYLETITKLRQFNFPFESLSFVYALFDKGFMYSDIANYYYWSYPIFTINNNDYIYQSWLSDGRTLHVIILVKKNIYTLQLWNENFNLRGLSNSQNYNANRLEILARPYGLDQYNLVKVTYNISDSRSYRLYYVGGNSVDIIPIYCNSNEYTLGMSTDFALVFGFSNKLLDNLNIIAQGTQQSNQSASGLESNTDQMQSDFNSYYSIENSANSDFNSALNGINFNDQIAGNQSFLDSASFVKTVFSSMMQIPILSTFVIILCIVLMARIFL